MSDIEALSLTHNVGARSRRAQISEVVSGTANSGPVNRATEGHFAEIETFLLGKHLGIVIARPICGFFEAFLSEPEVGIAFAFTSHISLLLFNLYLSIMGFFVFVYAN